MILTEKPTEWNAKLYATRRLKKSIRQNKERVWKMLEDLMYGTSKRLIKSKVCTKKTINVVTKTKKREVA